MVLGLATSHHEENYRYVFFHPHTVWSSLARTNSDGFLAPCFIKRREERTRKKEKFYIYLDVTHTHTFTHTLSHWRFYTYAFLHTRTFTYTHTRTFTHKGILHTHTRWHFYTNAILHTDRFYKHTHLLRSILSNYWCGMHRTCKNTSVKPDRSGWMTQRES